MVGRRAALLHAGFDFDEHLCVVVVFAHDLEEALDGFQGAVAGEAAADEVDFFELLGGEEECFAAGAAFEDVDGGVDVGLGDFAVDDELPVSGAFEFQEDEVVAFVVGFEEGGGYGDAGGGEEASWGRDGGKWPKGRGLADCGADESFLEIQGSTRWWGSVTDLTHNPLIRLIPADFPL
jgi:hypothetical protein